MVNKLQKITNELQLNVFVRGAKDDMAEPIRLKHDRLSLEEARRKEVGELATQLSSLERARPAYDMENYVEEDIIGNIDSLVSRSLDQALRLKNSIADVQACLEGASSQIVSAEQYQLLKSWLPAKYQSTPLKLLYTGKRDGMNPTSFHQKCDGKGATITLIKCQTHGQLEEHIIGGFLGESWESHDKYIESKEAFLFSVTNNIKCPIASHMTDAAGYGASNWGPTFGQGYDLAIKNDFSRLKICPSSYINGRKLIFKQPERDERRSDSRKYRDRSRSKGRSDSRRRSGSRGKYVGDLTTINIEVFGF